MEFIHTGDFHLDFVPPNIIGKDFFNERVKDYLQNLDEIIEYAIQRDVDLFLIAGDVFHSPRPKNNIFVEFTRRVGKLLDAGIPVLIVGGDHDLPKSIDSNNLLEGLNGVAKLFSFSRRARGLNVKVRGFNVGIVFAPYLDPLKIVPQYTISEYPKLIFGAIKREYEKIKNADYKILLAHFLVKGASFNKSWEEYSRDIPINLDEIDVEFDYIALGHVHTAQTISHNAAYSGSIERLMFAESSEDKFFIHGKIGSSVKVEMVKLKCRPMIVTDTIRVVGSVSPIEEIISELESMKIPNGAIVRVKVAVDKISFKLLRYDLHKLKDYLIKERNVLGFEIKQIMEFKEEDRSGKASRSETIVELFERYIDTKYTGYYEDERRLAKEIGKSLIERALEKR